MSCSKIFSGNLPELINKILQYFCDDYSTLHSCVLVNRSWCRCAIPLLWEDPFSVTTENYQFIGIYLHENDEAKTTLIEHGFNSNLFSSKTLFNYSSFIKYLDLERIFHCIRIWRRAAFSSTPSASKIFKALLKTFIENGARLHTLIISDLDIRLEDFVELILQNPNFIHNIKSLKLDIMNDNTANKIMKLLSSNCNLILTFESNFTGENCLSGIINSQQNIKKIIFFNNSLNHSLLSLSNSNCSNTLKTIIFSGIDFQNVVILNEVFEQLNVLESVHLLNCQSLDVQFMQQIINITKPFKLKSLIMMYEDVHVESFQLLLQKSGNYLENIGLSLQKFFPHGQGVPLQSKQQLFELITKYCPNIKFFDLSALIELNIYLAFNLIKNVGQSLNYLSIKYNEAVSSIVSQNLGRIIPLKLEYLSLTFSAYNTSDFEEFLKNSQNTFINKFLIRMECRSRRESEEDILPYIEKYIMEKKRAKYLAFDVTSLEGPPWDLFYLKDIVKKFKSYNIKVQGYDELCIDYLRNKKNNIFLDIFQ